MGGNSITPLVSLSSILGVNYDLARRNTLEAIDALNVIWDTNGLSVWRGESKFDDRFGGKQIRGIASIRWGDGHESLMAANSDGKLYARQAGVVTQLKLKKADGTIVAKFLGSITANQFVWFERLPFHNIVVFAVDGSTDLYKWDGHIDHNVEVFECSVKVKYVLEWKNRVLAYGDSDNPLLIYYSDLYKLEIQAANWIHFGDSNTATKIRAVKKIGLGMDILAVLGDKAAWSVGYTGQYPFFAQPVLISSLCSCIAKNSVVEGGGMVAWFGEDQVFATDGQTIRSINFSADDRKVNRLHNILRDILHSARHLINSYWHPERQILVWNYPVASGSTIAWRAVAYNPGADAWWPLSPGYSSTTIHNETGKDIILAVKNTYVVGLDYNMNKDESGNNIPWFVTIGGTADGIARFKFLRAAVKRPYGGTGELTFDFWTDCSPIPVRVISNVKYSYDRGADHHPSLDPEVYDGTPPDDSVTAWADVLLCGTRLVAKISNEEPGGVRQGPPIPLTSAVITGTRLS